MIADRLPSLTEREWQEQVTDLATLLGWEWAHWRAARTEHGWRTPCSGPLGQGFVDLILVSERQRRVLFVELKAERGRLSPEQVAVHARLRAAGLDVYVWRPSDLPTVAAILRQAPEGVAARA